MSRFFNALSSSSDSDDDSDNFAQGLQKTTHTPKFLVSSDEDDDIKRIIKSDIHKKIDLLNGHINKLDIYCTEKNFKKLHDEYDLFVKSINKSKSTFPDCKIPWFVIKMIVSLETLVENLWKNSDEKSKLNKMDLKALVPLRQKLRKNNLDYQTLIDIYKADPTNCIDNFVDIGSNEDKISETTEMMDNMELNEQFGDIASDDSIDDGDDSTSSFDIPTLGENQTPAQLRLLFLKKDFNKATVKRERKDKEIKVVKKKDVVEESDHSKMYHETKLFSNEDQVSLQAFLNKVKEIMKTRGKKSYYLSYKNDLTYMMNLTKKRRFGIHILCGLTLEIVMAIFENLSSDSLNSVGLPDEASSYESISRGRNEKKIEFIIEKLKLWIEAIVYLIGLVYMCLDESKKLVFTAESDTPAGNLFEITYTPNDDGFMVLQGDLFTFVNMADEHFVSLLNSCDYNIKEYMEILNYQAYLTKLIGLASSYYRNYHMKYPDNSHLSNRLAELYFIRIELNYFKPNNYLCHATTTVLGIKQSNSEMVIADPSKDTISIEWLQNEISSLSSQATTKMKSSLYLVYYFAINNKLEEAEKLFYSINIQNKLPNFDIYVQIQYNRTIIQLAICYFRHGYFQECYDILYSLWNTGKLRELIGQSAGKYNTKSYNDKRREVKDKRYPIPYYMQFSIHLIECLLIVSALLLQIHSIKDNLYSSDNVGVCDFLLDCIKRSNNRTIQSIPSTLGEHIVLAAKCIKCYNWKYCFSTIININAWKFFLDFDSFKPILLMEIKKQCLISYLFNFSQKFSCIKLASLVAMFELPIDIIRKIVTKIILFDNFKICWDESYQVIYPLVQSTHSLARETAINVLDKIEKTVHEHDILKNNKHNLMDLSNVMEFN